MNDGNISRRHALRTVAIGAVMLAGGSAIASQEMELQAIERIYDSLKKQEKRAYDVRGAREALAMSRYPARPNRDDFDNTPRLTSEEIDRLTLGDFKPGGSRCGESDLWRAEYALAVATYEHAVEQIKTDTGLNEAEEECGRLFDELKAISERGLNTPASSFDGLRIKVRLAVEDAVLPEESLPLILADLERICALA